MFNKKSNSVLTWAKKYCMIYIVGWGYSSVGRALQWHCRGQGFDSPYLHSRKNSGVSFKRRNFCLFTEVLYKLDTAFSIKLLRSMMLTSSAIYIFLLLALKTK